MTRADQSRRKAPVYRSGCAACAAEALRACQRVGSHFLFRARTQIKVQVVKRLKDGSRLVRMPVRKKGQRSVIVRPSPETLCTWTYSLHAGRQPI